MDIRGDDEVKKTVVNYVGWIVRELECFDNVYLVWGLRGYSRLFSLLPG